MALTLPYPDMDFVPLDILTAQEQDQLVANIEYIADQFPIQSANIANSAVKSQNIDWTTIERIPSPTTTVLSNIGDIASSTTISITQNGFIIGKAVTLSEGSATISLTNDNSGFILGGIPYTNYSGNMQVGFCVPVRSGETIYCVLQGGGKLEGLKIVDISY